MRFGVLFFVCGCASPLPEREAPARGTFGETTVTLLCARMAALAQAEGERVDVSGSLYREACRGEAALPLDAPGEVRALLARRDPLATALDAMWPEAMLTDVQAYATSPAFLTVYDDGSLRASATAIDGMLGELAMRPEALQALALLVEQDGYTPASTGVLASILRSDAFPAALRAAPAMVAPGGAAHPAFSALLAATSRELATLDVDEDPEATSRLLFDLLSRPDPLRDPATATHRWVATRDARGIARIALREGALPAPHVDRDGDGLADVDALGRYVDAAGTVIASPTPLPSDEDDPAGTPRDTDGRALVDGAPLYEYRDTEGSLFALLLREAAPLLDPERGIAIDLLRGLSLLLGERVETARDYDDGISLAYAGFDARRSPLFALAHALLQLVRMDDVERLLELATRLLREHEGAVAELAEALIEAFRVPGEDGRLEDDSRLLDDLVPVLRRLLDQDGLFEDVLHALTSPEVQAIGPYLADYVRYRDRVGYQLADDEETPLFENDIVDLDTGTAISELSQEIDRTRSDSGRDRSILQRILHLVADADGVSMCNQQDAIISYREDMLTLEVGPYDECALLQIDDLASFFLRSITFQRDPSTGAFLHHMSGMRRNVCDYTTTNRFVHNSYMPFIWDNDLIEAAGTDQVIELIVGIEEFGNCPTPHALTRALFLDLPSDSTITDLLGEDRPLGRSGDPIATAHAGSIAAWELGDFFSVVRPLVQPFADHDAERILVDLLVVLHSHWASRESETYQRTDPNGPNYAYASNLVSFEPLIAEALDRNRLLPALGHAVEVLEGIDVDGGPAVDVLRDAGRFALAPLPGLTTAAGESTLTRPSGDVVPAEELAPWHLAADALGDAADAIDEGGERGAALEDSVSAAVDLFLRASAGEDGVYRFDNPRVRTIALITIDFLRERLAAHEARGDRDTWLATDLPADVESLLAGPLFAALVDLLDAFAGDADARDALEALLYDALDPERDPAAFEAMLTALFDVAQLLLTAQTMMEDLGRALGAILEPARGVVDPLLTLTRAAVDADAENRVLAPTLRNLVAETPAGETPAGEIADAVLDTHRREPGTEAGMPLTADDLRAVFDSLQGFFGDAEHGLPRLDDIMRERDVTP